MSVTQRLLINHSWRTTPQPLPDKEKIQAGDIPYPDVSKVGGYLGHHPWLWTGVRCRRIEASPPDVCRLFLTCLGILDAKSLHTYTDAHRPSQCSASEGLRLFHLASPTWLSHLETCNKICKIYFIYYNWQDWSVPTANWSGTKSNPPFDFVASLVVRADCKGR